MDVLKIKLLLAFMSRHGHAMYSALNQQLVVYDKDVVLFIGLAGLRTDCLITREILEFVSKTQMSATIAIKRLKHRVAFECFNGFSDADKITISSRCVPDKEAIAELGSWFRLKNRLKLVEPLESFGVRQLYTLFDKPEDPKGLVLKLDKYAVTQADFAYKLYKDAKTGLRLIEHSKFSFIIRDCQND